MEYHNLTLSNMDFGDDLKILVCHQCAKSVAVEATEQGIPLWETMKVINQGDFFSLHAYSFFENNGSISISTDVA